MKLLSSTKNNGNIIAEQPSHCFKGIFTYTYVCPSHKCTLKNKPQLSCGQNYHGSGIHALNFSQCYFKKYKEKKRTGASRCSVFTYSSYGNFEMHFFPDPNSIKTGLQKHFAAT